MDQKTRTNLIGALADSFNGEQTDLTLETTNYITNTGTMDCTAMGLPLDALEKTKRVIEQHERKFAGENQDQLHVQYLMHLKIARKCVEEVMSLKNKHL